LTSMLCPLHSPLNQYINRAPGLPRGSGHAACLAGAPLLSTTLIHGF
jgi:hypothetical protein